MALLRIPKHPAAALCHVVADAASVKHLPPSIIQQLAS